MSDQTKTTTRTGMSSLGVLQIIFIVLKLCNLIAWSWWAVLIPLWIELACAVLAILIILLAIKVSE